MLIRILRTFLAPYRRPLAAVLILSLVGTMASLYLPSLNAAIIDEGIAKGDTGFIWRTGGVMLSVSLIQIVCSIAGVYFGANVAMSFGRDVRGAIFSRVLAFSSRELNRFGAPSLITRNTNDVQQVQMLVLMSATMFIAAPITMIGGVLMALREDVGLSWLVAVAVPLLAISVGLVVMRMRPLFRLMQTRIDVVNRVLREQITGIRVVRAFVREPYETQRFARANGDLTETATAVGRLMASIFPDRDVHPERLQRGGAVVRRSAGGQRCDADRVDDRLPDLSGADLDVGDDGDLPARCWRPGPPSAPSGSARYWRRSPRSSYRRIR